MDSPASATSNTASAAPTGDAADPAGPASRERLAQSLRQMVERAEDLLGSVQHVDSEPFKAARSRFEQQLRHARGELHELHDDALHRARHAARAADQAVQSHPYAAMGLSAGVGLLLGMLISRR